MGPGQPQGGQSSGPGRSPDACTEASEPDQVPEARPSAQRVPELGPADSPRRAWRALRMFPPQAAQPRNCAAMRPAWLRQAAQLRGLRQGSVLWVGPCGWALCSSRTGPGPVGKPQRRPDLSARSRRFVQVTRVPRSIGERLTYSSTESKIRRSN